MIQLNDKQNIIDKHTIAVETNRSIKSNSLYSAFLENLARTIFGMPSQNSGFAMKTGEKGGYLAHVDTPTIG